MRKNINFKLLKRNKYFSNFKLNRTIIKRKIQPKFYYYLFLARYCYFCFINIIFFRIVQPSFKIVSRS